MRSRAALQAAALCGALASALHVSAHEPPQVRNITVHDDEVVGVVTSRGLIVGPGLHDLDAHTDLVCRQWFGLTSVEEPALLRDEEGLWFATSRGAFRGDAAGCGWVTDPRFEDSALTSVKASPREGVLASGVSTGPLDGAFALTDNGDLRVERASESDRFVISATEATDGARYALLVSLDPSTNRPVYELERLRDDTTTPLGVLPLEEDDFRIVLVGSTERGDALLEVTRYEDSGRPDALLQVDTAGEQRVLGELEGPVAALADDAGTWIGSEDGLWRLERGALVLASDAFPVRALARVNGALLAGSAYPYGPLLARWLGDGAWERAARFDSVRGIAPCAEPEDLAERCAEEWEDWQRDVVPLEEDEQDALSDAGGLTADAGTGETPTPGEGCSAAAAPRALHPLALWALGLFALRRPRRRATERPA